MAPKVCALIWEKALVEGGDEGGKLPNSRRTLL